MIRWQKACLRGKGVHCQEKPFPEDSWEENIFEDFLSRHLLRPLPLFAAEDDDTLPEGRVF